MLQFITDPSATMPVGDQVRRAIDGGCRWIELAPDAKLAGDAEAMLPVCRDAEVFLMIDDDVELVQKLHNHGVHLTHADRERAMQVRELLGAHAVIGVSCVMAADAIALKGTDIDYVTFDVDATDAALDSFSAIAAQIAEAVPGLHIVARGEFPIDMLPRVLASGAAGVAMSASVAQAPDPAVAVKNILEVLEK